MEPDRKATVGPILRLVARRPATVVLVISAVLAAACVYAYLAQRQHLKQVIDEVIRTPAADYQTVRTLTRVVYEIPDFSANPSYFILPARRATPLQILRGGGDCSDRSLLLCALLEQAGLDATRVMLFDPATSRPGHTVVEVALAKGATGEVHQDAPYMVVDPSYDLYFPDEEEGTYYDLLDLRDDPSILSKRLSYLRARLPWPTRFTFYPVTTAGYGSASSFNWNKNRLTRLIFETLYPRLGREIYRLRRPQTLEEPQLFCAVLAGGIGVVAAVGIRLGRALVASPLVGDERLTAAPPTRGDATSATPNLTDPVLEAR